MENKKRDDEVIIPKWKYNHYLKLKEESEKSKKYKENNNYNYNYNYNYNTAILFIVIGLFVVSFRDIIGLAIRYLTIETSLGPSN